MFAVKCTKVCNLAEVLALQCAYTIIQNFTKTFKMLLSLKSMTTLSKNCPENFAHFNINYLKMHESKQQKSMVLSNGA